jgi:hypothetical protein
VQLERTPDADEKQHRGEEDGDPDVFITDGSIVVTDLELRAGLVVEPVGLRLVIRSYDQVATCGFCD